MNKNKENYYTADEVMRLLKLPRASFYREVDAGEIPYEIEPGKKRGRKYPKEAIDALLRLKKQMRPTTTFGKTTKAELWTRIQHSHRLYGDDYVPFDVALKWMSRNDDIFMNLRAGNQMVGGVTIMPLDEQTCIKLVNNEMNEIDIPLTSIKKWTDPDLYAYIATIAVYTEDRQEYGAALIRHTINWASKLYQEHDIKKWYAYAATPEGERILKFLGFVKVGQNPNRLGYVLTPEQHQVKYIKSLIDKINEW
ncbi:helix-turn-helix protein [Thermosporothrix hazakensis]|jgi:predicted DNA-binding transcriptional regulator AlpA|uniref:Helix-turn-helix protein n=1 Tax=Thermosporothrix hazakensis TaxID=644383 RepID=A0A326TZF0_THEHA|nr:helix-turn-helix domain-containing protein [Thermosporothrix hazakensis]PZW22879.1 helix-turn-helix protein [Thermosporothrix hazakensis]GCE48030.1 hypothetical protein KTH_28990 [Thermosporothrix hazakensis]